MEYYLLMLFWKVAKERNHELVSLLQTDLAEGVDKGTFALFKEGLHDHDELEVAWRFYVMLAGAPFRQCTVVS